jgi:hypothetical protein
MLSSLLHPSSGAAEQQKILEAVAVPENGEGLHGGVGFVARFAGRCLRHQVRSFDRTPWLAASRGLQDALLVLRRHGEREASWEALGGGVEWNLRIERCIDPAAAASSTPSTPPSS